MSVAATRRRCDSSNGGSLTKTVSGPLDARGVGQPEAHASGRPRVLVEDLDRGDLGAVGGRRQRPGHPVGGDRVGTGRQGERFGHPPTTLHLDPHVKTTRAVGGRPRPLPSGVLVAIPRAVRHTYRRDRLPLQRRLRPGGPGRGPRRRRRRRRRHPGVRRGRRLRFVSGIDRVAARRTADSGAAHHRLVTTAVHIIRHA